MSSLLSIATGMLGQPKLSRKKLDLWGCGCKHLTNLKRKLTRFTPCHEHIHEWGFINNIKEGKPNFHVY